MNDERPLCFVDPRIFKLWKSSRMDECVSQHCTDCLPSYKLQMQREGRCEHPETKFDIRPEGGLFGYWPVAA